MWFMPAEPVPADPGPEDDLAWLDRDPMTAGEREASLDRLCEQDEPPEEEEECEDDAPLTAEELAEVRQAAADDLLAVQAAAAGRRGPGQPGSARIFPGESSSRAAGFGPGMALDVLPGCAQLAVAADAAAVDDGFGGVSEAELVGLVCAWDRVEAHAAARKLAVIAGLDGGMDELRARVYLDLLLGTDSRPRHQTTAGGGGDGAGPDSSGGRGGSGGPGGGTPPGGPAGSAGPAGFAGRVTLTVPLGTLAHLADRPGELAGLGPIDPWLARDLAAAAARNPTTTWCVTVTDQHGHAVGHGCARPEPASHRKRAGPGPPGGAGFTFTPASRDGPPGAHGTWILRTPGDGPDLRVTLDPLTTDPCDHRYQAPGHDPGVKLRHLAQIRHATCTSPVCRRPAAQCDHEHNIPYEAGGRSCLCNTGPKCRHDHRLKQHPNWTVDQLPDGTFTWTTPAGRTYTTEPTRYPV
jgi:hypothetical protein